MLECRSHPRNLRLEKMFIFKFIRFPVCRDRQYSWNAQPWITIIQPGHIGMGFFLFCENIVIPGAIEEKTKNRFVLHPSAPQPIFGFSRTSNLLRIYLDSLLVKIFSKSLAFIYSAPIAPQILALMVYCPSFSPPASCYSPMTLHNFFLDNRNISDHQILKISILVSSLAQFQNPMPL